MHGFAKAAPFRAQWMGAAIRIAALAVRSWGLRYDGKSFLEYLTLALLSGF